MPEDDGCAQPGQRTYVEVSLFAHTTLTSVSIQQTLCSHDRVGCVTASGCHAASAGCKAGTCTRRGAAEQPGRPNTRAPRLHAPQEVAFIRRVSAVQCEVDPGFVPNMRVPGRFYVNAELEALLFDELRAFAARGGHGGFPAGRQAARQRGRPAGHRAGLHAALPREPPPPAPRRITLPATCSSEAQPLCRPSLSAGAARHRPRAAGRVMPAPIMRRRSSCWSWVTREGLKALTACMQAWGVRDSAIRGSRRACMRTQRSIAMPDIHSGYGFAIGNVAAFDMADPTQSSRRAASASTSTAACA